jgi:hypothetical protein
MGDTLNPRTLKRRVEMLNAVSIGFYPSAASGAPQQQKVTKNNKKH